MKTVVKRKELLNALNIAFKAISSKSPLPILTHFLLEAGDGKLKISATDSDLGIETACEAQDCEDGAFTTVAKTLLDIISLMDDEYVTISQENSSDTECEISSDTSSCALMTLSSEDFPVIPHFEEDPDFMIKQSDLKTGIKNVIFSAAAHEESRAILTGICLTVSGGKAEFAATDARRLATCSVPAYSENPEPKSYVIPRRTLDEISKFLKPSDDPVFVGIKGSIMFFRVGEIFITSRLLDGRYPNFRQVIPSMPDFASTVDRKAFISALKLLLVLSQDKNYKELLCFDISKSQIQARAKTQDLGRGAKSVPCSFEGNPEFTISCNGNLILAALSNMDGDEVLLEVSDPDSPIVIRLPEPSEHLCVIMPMKIRDNF
ncbi:MAG: DNA polymerase III subunit beta [bacterium]|nr:DNA polymerase III subunit beta [bacterium]